MAITNATQKPSTSLAEIQALVETDIALSAKLLQVANSASSGLRERVSSVRRAVTLLGFKTVKALAIGFLFNAEFGRIRIPGLPYPDLPRYAVACSAVAEAVADVVAPDLSSDAGSLGLLHESGLIVMAMAFGQQYRDMVAGLAQSGLLLHEAEYKQFGIDHATAGKMLLGGWRIIDPFLQAVAFHHSPDLPITANTTRQTMLLWKLLTLSRAAGSLFFQTNASSAAAEALQLARRHFNWRGPDLGAAIRAAAPIYRQRSAVFDFPIADTEARCATAIGASTRVPTEIAV